LTVISELLERLSESIIRLAMAEAIEPVVGLKRSDKMTPDDRASAEKTPRERRAVFTVGELLVAIAIILVLITFLQPARSRARPAARKAQCRNNLKQIAIALHNYHDAHGSFPPAYIADEDGRPMHSWRVLILPYLDQKALYEEYDFDEPWDGPDNSRLAAVEGYLFQCPEEQLGMIPVTSYVAVAGPNSMWPGGNPTSFGDCADDPDNTLLVVEVANSGINWMEPRDLDISEITPQVNPKNGRGISSLHAGSKSPRKPCGAHAAFVDGSVRFLPENTRPEQLRAMLIRSDGEPVGPIDVEK